MFTLNYTGSFSLWDSKQWLQIFSVTPCCATGRSGHTLWLSIPSGSRPLSLTWYVLRRGPTGIYSTACTIELSSLSRLCIALSKRLRESCLFLTITRWEKPRRDLHTAQLSSQVRSEPPFTVAHSGESFNLLPYPSFHPAIVDWKSTVIPLPASALSMPGPVSLCLLVLCQFVWVTGCSDILVKCYVWVCLVGMFLDENNNCFDKLIFLFNVGGYNSIEWVPE